MAPVSPQIQLGIYVKPGSSSAGGSAEGLDAITQLEDAIGHKFSIIQTFTSWDATSGSGTPFPTEFADFVEAQGSTPMVTWQPESAPDAAAAPGGVLSNQPDYSLSVITGGRYDSYIRSWADQAKAFGHTVLVRPMQEPNDKTFPWSLGVNGNNSPQDFVDAWRHIFTIFQAEGATNVQFVWCVGATPSTPNPVAMYPGDAYVSWVGIDGYNRSNKWRSFSEIFGPVYQDVTSATAKPVMIPEIGCTEDPSDPSAKAQWITDSFTNVIPHQFPRIKAVLYFDAPGKGFDYPLDSSQSALQAFAAVAASPVYGG